MTRATICKVLAALVSAAVLGLHGPASASETKSCYAASTDADGDGYAATGSASTQVVVGDTDLNCPSGYVGKAGDCDDASATVHPRRYEIGSNGINDDCTAGVDQNEPMYGASGFDNTTTSFRMYVFVRDADVVALGSAALGEIEVEELGSGNVEVRPRETVPVYTSWWGGPMVDVVVDGLEATTVYRARIRFYEHRAASFGPDVGFTPEADVEVGGASDWYYTTTDGTAEKPQARTAMVLQAFEELELSDNGVVGYEGTMDIDGTRYDADVNENWCSEFYVWVADGELSGMSGFSRWDQMVDYFTDHGSWYTDTGDIEAEGRRGDYVGMDTDDDGEINHSGMFLALDADGTTIWTIEGNSNYNTVAIRERVIGDQILGLGHITNAMLA